MEEMWNAYDEQTQATAVCTYDASSIHYVVTVKIGEKEKIFAFPAFQIPVDGKMIKADLNASYEAAVKLADSLV